MSAKFLIYQMPHLQLDAIKNLVVVCSNIDEFVVASEKYNEFLTVVVLKHEQLGEVRPFLSRQSIDTIYILTDGEKFEPDLEPWWQKTTVVYNEKQLMRHVCTKSMLCYFNEGMEHRKNENVGLSNACMVDSLRALEHSANFI